MTPADTANPAEDWAAEQLAINVAKEEELKLQIESSAWNFYFGGSVISAILRIIGVVFLLLVITRLVDPNGNSFLGFAIGGLLLEVVRAHRRISNLLQLFAVEKKRRSLELQLKKSHSEPPLD